MADIGAWMAPGGAEATAGLPPERVQWVGADWTPDGSPSFRPG